MNTGHSNLSLHPDHLADLRKSLISDDTIHAAGIHSVVPGDIDKILGPSLSRKVASLMAIPYLRHDGFIRYKLFPPVQTENGTIKYFQPPGSGNHLYQPPGINTELEDLGVCLGIVEGEKKSLCLQQVGVPCVGIGGLWNYKNKDEDALIADFDLIKLRGRDVYIYPDNDWLDPDSHGERKNLREAVYGLAYHLIDRGARVYVVELPAGPGKGVDDYLCDHSVDELQSLPRRRIKKQSIEKLIAEATPETLPEILKRLSVLSKETEKSIHVNALSQRLGIPKTSIKKDLKQGGPQRADDTKLLTTAYFPGLVDLVTDQDGAILFLAITDGLIEGITVHETGGDLYKPPEKAKIPFSIPRAEEVLRWFKEDAPDALFNDLLSHFKRFSYLSDNQFIITTFFTFLTYIQDHPEIHFFLMLLFWSSPERGKSRTGKAMTACCFRGIHIVDIREANLFRYSQDFRATLFIDVMDLWKKTEKNASEDVLLLRYEKGAKVARVLYPEKGAFNDMVFFDVYGPTIMASNQPVHHILDTRCLPIAMQNKPGVYADGIPEESLILKERLTAWRAKVMGESLPQIELIPTITGRLWDISKPLFQVCKMVSPSHFEILKGAILEIAGQRAEDKQETLDGQIVSALKELSPEGITEWRIQIKDVTEKLNKKRPADQPLTERSVGERIKGLSVPKKRIGGVYNALMTRTVLDTLLKQFGFDLPPEHISGETSLTSLMSQNPTNSDSCSQDIQQDIAGHCEERHDKRPGGQTELF